MLSPPFAASDPGSCSIYPCHNSFVGESGSAELAELAALVGERNAVEARIAALLERPAQNGHMGKWIAGRVFDIELESAANAAGYDGKFTTGPLRGKTVNIKTYARDEGTLDMGSPAPCEYYLVLAGPRTGSKSGVRSARPFCIATVYLLDAHELRAALRERGVKSGEAASVRRMHWDAGEIYPRDGNPILVVNELQRQQLRMFACSD